VIVSRIADRTIHSPSGPIAVTCVDVSGLRDDNRLKNSVSTPAQPRMSAAADRHKPFDARVVVPNAAASAMKSAIVILSAFY
jgi:hypothetical protein